MVEVLARGVPGVKKLWGIVNFLPPVCLALMVLIIKMVEHSRRYTIVNGHKEALQRTGSLKASALALFSVQRIFNFTIKFGKLII